MGLAEQTPAPKHRQTERALSRIIPVRVFWVDDRPPLATIPVADWAGPQPGCRGLRGESVWRLLSVYSWVLNGSLIFIIQGGVRHDNESMIQLGRRSGP